MDYDLFSSVYKLFRTVEYCKVKISYSKWKEFWDERWKMYENCYKDWGTFNGK